MNWLVHLLVHAGLVSVFLYLEARYSAGWLFSMLFLSYFILTSRAPHLHIIAVLFMVLQVIATTIQSLLLGSLTFLLINLYCLLIDDEFLHHVLFRWKVQPLERLTQLFDIKAEDIQDPSPPSAPALPRASAIMDALMKATDNERERSAPRTPK